MTNNVKSCKKNNRRAQTFRFSVFTIDVRSSLLKSMKTWPIKTLVSQFFKYFEPFRMAPCPRACPGLSKYV